MFLSALSPSAVFRRGACGLAWVIDLLALLSPPLLGVVLVLLSGVSALAIIFPCFIRFFPLCLCGSFVPDGS